VIPGKLSFIKIDIEGSEVGALRGARKTILEHRPTIWIEINPIALERQGHSAQELQDVVEDLGYKVAEFHPPGAGWHGYKDAQCDALLLPQ
jgi:Methyltransferase FkbM domain